LRAMIIFISIYRGEDRAKEKSFGAVRISLTRQPDQKCGIETLRKSCREGSVRDKASSRR